ncbi:MAG: biotin/lipoyl-containing protein, partial [Gammaproteobacteria bacterium]
MIEVLVPRENVNDDVVIILNLMVESGTEVKVDQPIMEIETSKTNIEISAPETGTIHFNVAEGEEVPVGDVLCQISNDESDGPKIKSDDKLITDDADTELVRHISKSAATAASKYGVDIAAIQGSWIGVRDVMAAAGKPIPDNPAISKRNVQQISAASATDKPDGLPKHTTEKLDLRKRSEIANLSVFGSELRQSSIGMTSPLLKQRLAKPIPLFVDGISDLVVYEASRLLKQFPLLNSFYASNNSISLYEEVHAGISFDNNRNLKVLRIENTDRL